MYSDIDTMYREAIIDLYRQPLNKKILADFDLEQREYNPLCGDDITVQVKFDEEGRVADIGHHGTGCAISQAAASLITEEVKSKKVEEILPFTEQKVYDLLGFTVIYTRQKCATLGLKAIQGAILSNYAAKHSKSPHRR